MGKIVKSCFTVIFLRNRKLRRGVGSSLGTGSRTYYRTFPLSMVVVVAEG